MNTLVKKFILLIALFFNASILVSAQLAYDRIRKNEIGFALRFSSNYETNAGAREVIYKRWFKPWQAYRIFLGVENQNKYISSKYQAIDNTLYRQTTGKNTKLFFVGGGIEAQRHFYKRVFLFAGIDTRFMYGKGNEEQQTFQYVNDSLVSSTNPTVLLLNTQRQATTKFHWELRPSIGAKLVFKRITLGIESFPMEISYQVNKNKVTSATYNLFDFDIGGNRSNRLFVMYRF